VYAVSQKTSSFEEEREKTAKKKRILSEMIYITHPHKTFSLMGFGGRGGDHPVTTHSCSIPLSYHI
jgi:hypothetical protein